MYPRTCSVCRFSSDTLDRTELCQFHSGAPRSQVARSYLSCRVHLSPSFSCDLCKSSSLVASESKIPKIIMCPRVLIVSMIVGNS